MPWKNIGKTSEWKVKKSLIPFDDYSALYCLLRLAPLLLALLPRLPLFLHFLVASLFCSQLGSLFSFIVSVRTISFCALHALQVPFSYRQAFLQGFLMVFVGSQVACELDPVSPAFFFSVRVLIRVFVAESHSDQGPFSYLQGSFPFFAPRSLLMSTSFSSSSQISPSARTRDAKKKTVTKIPKLHFIFTV